VLKFWSLLPEAWRGSRQGLLAHRRLQHRKLENSVSLTLTGLRQGFDIPVLVGGGDPLNFLHCAVAAMTFDENHLNVIAEPRHSFNCSFNVSTLIARRNHNGSGANITVAKSGKLNNGEPINVW